MERKAQESRKTAETDIHIELNVDGSGKAKIDTGIGFFDHMLVLLCVHARFDMVVRAKGDLEVDGHHTVEDTGIVLGRALKAAAGDKKSIQRYGMAYVPMDEALTRVVLDFCGRVFAKVHLPAVPNTVGGMDTELIVEFFRALCTHAGLTLHVQTLYGENSHHIIESVFKAFGRALRQALTEDASFDSVASSKGVLD